MDDNATAGRTHKRSSLLRVLVYLLLAGSLVIVWVQAERVGELEREAAAQERELTEWKGSSRTYERHLRRLRREVRRSVGSLDAPHFEVWNACGIGARRGCPIGPGTYYSGGVPDTFTFYPHFRATVPVKVLLMTLDDYVCFRTQQCEYHYRFWGPTKQLGPSPNRNSNPYGGLDLGGAEWHLSEGCADYIVVYTAEEFGTLYPRESITFNPASAPTGACR